MVKIELEGVNLHYFTARDREMSFKAFVFNRLRRRRDEHRIGDIHALRDASLTIGQGERVGLLGHNGAGKSTLLKVIAEVYPIASGQLVVEGSVRTLFELGLGFEPEATGRENILYRGLLLGQTPAQMRELETEITEFTELGEFLDYPIKAYSAGMQVRLAFAVSTAIAGDILLIDEVIGTGDMHFMHKARERISRLMDRAQIMLMASHDMTAIRQFCNRGLVLDHGRIMFDGPINEAADFYESRMD